MLAADWSRGSIKMAGPADAFFHHAVQGSREATRERQAMEAVSPTALTKAEETKQETKQKME